MYLRHKHATLRLTANQSAVPKQSTLDTHVVIKAVSFFLHGEGPCSRYYGRTTTLRLFVQLYDEDEDEQFFLPSFTSNGAPVQ
jgi:hypothetical protein